MVTDLPKYMTDVLKFNIKATGTLSALPYVAMWIAAFFFGLLCDFCVKRGYHSVKNARKIYTTVGKNIYNFHNILIITALLILRKNVFSSVINLKL